MSGAAGVCVFVFVCVCGGACVCARMCVCGTCGEGDECTRALTLLCLGQPI